MASTPNQPRPDIDRPNVAPDEAPPPNIPSQPVNPHGPDEIPVESPATDVPNESPQELPSQFNG